ncbi:MAG: hypothetical protein RLY20_2015 [Verrucomicrobiota bacterium]
MSLINDALKRTKEAQQLTPAAANGPELKTIDSATAKTASSSKTLLYIMVACVFLGNALIFLHYFLNDQGNKKPAPATASTNIVSPQVTAAVTPPSPAAVSATPPAAQPATNSSSLADTNIATVTAPEPPKPAPLRLQSIIFNPRRPSAMVSGKFVFVGDKVQGFRVTAINQESVTLIGNGQTNVLSLPE